MINSAARGSASAMEFFAGEVVFCSDAIFCEEAQLHPKEAAHSSSIKRYPKIFMMDMHFYLKMFPKNMPQYSAPVLK
jgi:hypothetical protein